LSTNTLVSFEITSEVAVPAPPGDVDVDGNVDGADLALLSISYGTTEGALWRDGDLDGDGRVDLADVGVVAANQSDAVDSAREDNTLAPEPPAAILVGIALVAVLAGLFAYRRSRSRGPARV
jgi:hypothetical protein